MEGDAEVVHWGTDHDHVRVQELGQHLFGVGRFGRVGLGQRTAAQVGHRLGVQVAVADLQVRHLVAPLLDHRS